jgi:hypothetical protein
MCNPACKGGGAWQTTWIIRLCSPRASPRAAAGQLYLYDFAVGHPAALEKARVVQVNYNSGLGFSASGSTGRNSIRLAYCYPLLHTIEEGIKRLAGVFAL